MLTTAAAQTFVYVANYNNNTISAFKEQKNGNLIPRGQTPVLSGPESITTNPYGWVLTADSSANAVTACKINTHTGRLRVIENRHEAPNANPFSLTTTPNGHFVYVANSGNNTIGIFRITQTRFLSVGVTTENHGTSPYNIALTPNGKFLYVANFGNDTIGIYQRHPGHGALIARGTFSEPPGDGPYGLAVGPSGHFLYVADFRANVILVLHIARNGQLNLSARVTEPFDHHPDSLVVDPSGHNLLVANTSANDISLFRINQKNGHLKHIGHVATGGYPFSLTLDAAAHYVFVVNYGTSTINRYRLNSTTGILTPTGITHEVTNADPYGITAITLNEGPALGLSVGTSNSRPRSRHDQMPAAP